MPKDEPNRTLYNSAYDQNFADDLSITLNTVCDVRFANDLSLTLNKVYDVRFADDLSLTLNKICEVRFADDLPNPNSYAKRSPYINLRTIRILRTI